MAQAIGATPMPAAWQLEAHTAALPTAVAEPRPEEAARILATINQLRGTESGREVADFLADRGVEIRVMPDADFARSYPGAGAVYEPRTKLISVPLGALDRGSFVTTLAHEGKHAMDFADRPHWALQSLGLMGGSASDGARALVTLRNPVTAWLDSLTARMNEDEVTAYHLQAKVAHELGRNESDWSLGQARDGTPLPLEEIRTNIATADLYRMEPNRRLVLGGSLGLTATGIAAFGVELLAGKLRPGSYLAAHAWPTYAIGGALTAAWVLGDQLRARRLEAGVGD